MCSWVRLKRERNLGPLKGSSPKMTAPSSPTWAKFIVSSYIKLTKCTEEAVIYDLTKSLSDDLKFFSQLTSLAEVR